MCIYMYMYLCISFSTIDRPHPNHTKGPWENLQEAATILWPSTALGCLEASQQAWFRGLSFMTLVLHIISAILLQWSSLLQGCMGMIAELLCWFLKPLQQFYMPTSEFHAHVLKSWSWESSMGVQSSRVRAR